MSSVSFFAGCTNFDPDMPCPLPIDPNTQKPALTKHKRLINDKVEKVCQVMGDSDVETGQPTMNQTATRANLYGNDLGSPFMHKGKLYFLFGDSSTKNMATHKLGDDSIAISTDPTPENCLNLSFMLDGPNDYRTFRVPGVTMGIFEAPHTGFSINGNMYVIATTDGAEKGKNGRSILAKSTDDGYNFSQVFEVSPNKPGRFTVTHASSFDPEVNQTEGMPYGGDKQLFLVGVGPNALGVSLAIIPEATVENKSTWRYFAGLNEIGLPKWVNEEKDSISIFKDDFNGIPSMYWNQYLNKFLMLYDGPEGVNMRMADNAWGPWSERRVIFDATKDQGFCFFIHSAWKKTPALDLSSVCDCISSADSQSRPGNGYSPYQIPQMAKSDGRGGTHIYFTLSTDNPYTVVLMRAHITGAIQ